MKARAENTKEGKKTQQQPNHFTMKNNDNQVEVAIHKCMRAIKTVPLS